MKIGFIGCGSIGQFLLNAINVEKRVPNLTVESVFDVAPQFPDQIDEISAKYQCNCFTDFNDFLNQDLDLYVEAAHPNATKAYALDILKRGKNMVIVSVGALTDNDFLNELSRECVKNNCHIYLPSGAIGGLDVLSAANSSGELGSVQLVTRKPPHALSMSVKGMEPETVFSGTAAEAIAKFPQNINVAITLSVAGIGVDKTSVEIIADPNVERNIHEVTAKGAFGQFKMEFENLPMPTNEKTSYLAALSVLSTLQHIKDPIRFQENILMAETR
jgi:aspartate dehydrogenase